MKSSKIFTLFLMLTCFNFYLSIYAQECPNEKFIGQWKSGDITFTSFKPTLQASSKNNYLTLAFIISQSNDTLYAKRKVPTLMFYGLMQHALLFPAMKLNYTSIK